jgi:signal transduction histidine kinase
LTQLSAAADPKILYIDDDPLNRSLINRLLSSYELQVIEAETGLDGIRIARREIPDLILMDLNMPGLDGHETTTRIRSIRGLRNTPIIALTVRTGRGERELALAVGCDGYITKPIDVDSFPYLVIDYLQGRKDKISKDVSHHYLGKYSQKLVQRLEKNVVELQEANARLQKIDKIKSDFVTLAAHELRTPITLVYGYSRLLQSEVLEKKEEQNQLLEDGNIGDLTHRIYRSVQRLSEVINDILNISLIEADEMSLDRRPVRLGEIIYTVLDELIPAKTGRTLDISVESLDTLPDIDGDSERLRQVFWNILSNAIKFTPDHGSILVKGWVAYPPDVSASKSLFAPATTENPKGDVVIMVNDSGIGIDPSEQKEIFERFYIVEDTSYHSTSKTAFGGGGMGLGLPIAQGIIAAHKGRVWVESAGRDEANSSGSTFYVLLPIDSARR